MESLPPELFDNIFEYITDIPDLLSLRAVNKFFNSRFTPPAFASMTLVNNRTVLERAVNIVSSPLARWVTDLCIKFCRAGQYILNSLILIANNVTQSLMTLARVDIKR